MDSTFNNILMDIDDPDGDSQPVIDAASQVCGDSSRLHLFNNLYHRKIIDEDAPGDKLLAEARELLLQSHRTQLDEIADTFNSPTESHIVWSDDGWQALIGVAQQTRAELVIAQTRPQTRWQRMALGNDDWELIRHCPKPLWLVRKGANKQYRRILAAVDPLHVDDKPADLDHRILNLAEVFARQFDAELEIINVVPPVIVPATITEPLVAYNATAQESSIEVHRQRINELSSDLDCSRGDITVLNGNPAELIIEHVADNDIDLLVMGAVARSALARMLIGSTAEQVLDHVSCDVLIAKPAQFDPRLPSTAGIALL